MTEDSQNGVRGYGPFQEGAEPTEQIATHDAGAPTDPAASPTHSEAPTQPPAGPTQPASASVPAQPSAVPAQPSAVPAQPSAVPAQPSAVPAQSSAVPAQSSSAPPQHPAAPGQHPAAPFDHPAAAGSQTAGDPYATTPINAQPVGGAYSPSQASSGGAYRWSGGRASSELGAQAGGAYPSSGTPAVDGSNPASGMPASGMPASGPPSAGGAPATGGYFPVSGTPSSGAPSSAAPTSGAYPEPSSAAPASGSPYGYGPFQGGDPTGDASAPGGAYPTSGVPLSGAPTSSSPAIGDPWRSAPTSGTPASGTPASPAGGTPASPAGAPQSYGPFHSTPPQDNWSAATPDPVDPFGLPPSSFTGRRIEPSPPPDRSRLLLGMAAGLVAGLLLFGTGGWFAGRASAPEAAELTAAPTAPAPTSSLGIFEQSQVAINQPDFDGTGLTAISQGWMPYLSSCSRSGRPGGPTLNEGETNRVRCTVAGMSAIFVEYRSLADRDKARVRTLSQNVDARTLTPGVGPSVERSTPSNRTSGNYVEYAFALTESGTTRTVAGIWWDDAQTPIAAYLLAYWKDGIGERWEPMRDLWSRYA